jgi:hypothetical protein
MEGEERDADYCVGKWAYLGRGVVQYRESVARELEGATSVGRYYRQAMDIDMDILLHVHGDHGRTWIHSISPI